MKLSLPNKKPTVKESLVRMACMKRDYCILPVVELKVWRKLKEVEKDLHKEEKSIA
jgi:uncharacterized protein YjhX (UPF0386 family)